jgi:tetratricopeptide (TPR) repeat protein
VDYDRFSEEAPLLRAPLPGFGTVGPLGLVGLVLVLGRRGWPRLLALFVAVYSLSVVLFFVFSRFRMTMMPAIFVLAALAIVELGRRLATARRQRIWAPAARLALWAIVCFAFVNLPVRGNPEGLGYRIAQAIGLPVHPERAAVARFNLGVAYAERAGDAEDPSELLGRAERELRDALAAGVDPVRARIELGKVLARQGRDREAIDEYRAVLAVEPGRWREQHALGILYRRNGVLDNAADAFRRALAVEAHAVSAVALGEVLAEHGRVIDARAAFRRALELEPGNEAAARGLRRTEAP